MMSMREIRKKLREHEVSQKNVALTADLHPSQISEYLKAEKTRRAENRRRLEATVAGT